MRFRSLFALLILVVFIFPILPLPGFQPVTSSNKISTAESDWTSSQPIHTQTNAPNPYEQLLDSVPSPGVITPSAPQSNQGTGYQQVIQPQWTLNETFLGANQDDDVEVYIDKGFLYSEIMNFTHFGSPNHPATIVGEDFPPNSTLYIYTVGTGDLVFISFNATWRTPIVIQGVSLNFWDGSKGPIDLTIFGAKYNATSGFNTSPDMSNKISQTWTFNFGPTASGTEEWVFFDFLMYEAVVLDPSMTYGNMFYLALSLNSPSAKVDLNLCEDADPVDPDMEDEADVWIGSGGSLLFYDWDFYLDVDVFRFPYPSEISLQVNSTIVQNIPYYPGMGIANFGAFPSINITDSTRYYNVTSTEPTLVFDTVWKGWFYTRIWTHPTYTVYVNETFVDWDFSAYVDFPDRAYNRVIYGSIEKGWTIVDVLRNTLSHPFWSRIPGSTVDYVQILNVSDGDYTILCQSPNHVTGVEVFDETWTPVTEVYATEFVIVRGYLEEPGGAPISTGFGYLNVYDPNDVLNHTDSYTPELGYVDLVWGIYWTVVTCEAPSIYTLNVIWANGTAAGMNSTTLTVNPMSRLYILEGTTEPGSEVVKGTDFQIVVFYSDHAWNGLSNATLTLQNDTSMTPWQPWSYLNLREEFENETYAGYYVIYAHTNESLTDVLHKITLSIVEAPYPTQSYSTNFTVIQAAILQISFIKGRGTIWDPIAHQWRTSPEPYINQTGLQFTVRVFGRNNTPVTDVTLFPVLSWQGRNKSLLWEDLHDQGGLPGYYNITIDMTPIHGITFHIGDIPIIQIKLVKAGYQPGISEVLYVHPQARPSFIDIPNPPPALYPNWTYLIPLRVVLRDGLTGEDVSHGTVTVNIPYLGNITLNLATPGLGLYEITSLTTTNMPPGDHEVTIYASASDYLSSTINGTLTILPKSSIQCTVLEPPSMPAVYGTMSITIQFYKSTSSPSAKMEGKQETENLPEGTKVTLEARGLSGNLPPDTQYLDDDGAATFQIEINHDDYYTLFVTIEGDEDYWGLDGISLNQLAGVNQSFEFVHPMTQFLSLLPIIIIILLLLIGSSILYRQKVMLPKRRKKLAKYQSIADTFSDVANLNRLLVLHKESGICVFDPFAEESQDATLVAGFLQAISTFGHDIGDSPGLTDDSEEARTLRELQYEGFRILINDGKFVRIALVLSGIPSEQLRNRLETFTDIFETRYKADFEHWEGRVDQFNSASDLVEEVFLISLRHPHSVTPRKPRGVQLSSLESDVYKLSKELTKDREYIFLGQILSTYLAAAKTEKLEVLMAIYQLRMKGILEPIQLAPVPSSDTSAG